MGDCGMKHISITIGEDFIPGIMTIDMLPFNFFSQRVSMKLDSPQVNIKSLSGKLTQDKIIFLRDYFNQVLIDMDEEKTEC
jgi:hypothetical protein